MNNKPFSNKISRITNFDTQNSNMKSLSHNNLWFISYKLCSNYMILYRFCTDNIDFDNISRYVTYKKAHYFRYSWFFVNFFLAWDSAVFNLKLSAKIFFDLTIPTGWNRFLSNATLWSIFEKKILALGFRLRTAEYHARKKLTKNQL